MIFYAFDLNVLYTGQVKKVNFAIRHFQKKSIDLLSLGIIMPREHRF